MGIVAIASIYTGNNLIGFRLLDSNSLSVKDVPTNSIINVISSGKVQIDNLCVENCKLQGSNGSIDRLPKVVDGKLKGKSALTILNKIGEQGYTVSDYKGQVLKLKEEDVIKYSKQNGISNGKIVEKDGKEFISSIIGEYEKIEIPANKSSASVKTTVNNSNKPVSKKSRINNSGNLSKSIICKHTGMTVEQKVARSIIQMKKTHAFYFAIYSLLKRVEDNDVDTMGVSTDTLYYNPKFVAELTEAELNFINLHEICHIAMMHNIRKKNRNHLIFNIACDLYINKLLSEEFGVRPGEKTVVNGVPIQFPKDGQYNSNTDTKKETPESIYEELIKDMKQENNKGNKGGSGQGQGQGSSSGSQSSENEQDEKDSESSGGGNNEQNEKNKANSRESGVYRGREYSIGEDESDLLSTSEETKSSISEAKVKQLLEQAMIRSHGVGSGNLMREVEMLLAPKVDWRKLLRNKLIEATQKINTLARPDKRFISRNMILPGPKLLDPDKINGVKICIDTSGSMSDTDLGIIYSQVKDMINQYKVGAEVIYWEYTIQDTKEFKQLTLEQFMKFKPKGGGGTDPNCLFKYFNSKECKIKPSVIIIFTDGMFGGIAGEYKSKYRDTIWVLNENNSDFSPGFGKIAPLKNVI